MRNELAIEFNKTMGVSKTPVTHEAAKHRIDLILDEVLEAYSELYGSVNITVEDGKVVFAGFINAKEIDTNGLAAEFGDIDYITSTGAEQLGFNHDAVTEEKHRSNMSKVIPWDVDSGELAAELTEAIKRYPKAEISQVDGGYVLKCGRTGKVIKPMCYLKAVITDEMAGRG